MLAKRPTDQAGARAVGSTVPIVLAPGPEARGSASPLSWRGRGRGARGGGRVRGGEAFLQGEVLGASFYLDYVLFPV